MRRTRKDSTARHALALVAVATLVILANAAGSYAGSTPEQKCQQSRYLAAAKYHACEEKAVAKYAAITLGSTFDQPTASKCRVKYTATWAKLQAKASGTGSTCDNPRFAVAAGAVTDRLTGLQWEQKTDDSSVHDKDNLYSWSAGGNGFTAADGSAYTSFLTTLNSGACFVGQCDWRLPTRSEIQTILSDPYPCTTSPCVDQVAFGPTVADIYWTSTTNAFFPADVWGVLLTNGDVGSVAFGKGHNWYARAVRGGL